MMTTLPPLMDSITEVIGNTPMLRLSRITRALGLRGTLLAKLEYLNPGHSKKDRIALRMLTDAKASGNLRSGQAIVELTSGNTGTGLAICCRAMRHPFIAVMSRGNTPERARMMRALGAEVVLVDQSDGSVPGQVSGDDLGLVESRARQLTAERDAFRLDQFQLASNALAYECHAGREMWEQSQGAVDVFVDFAGTGGGFSGTMKALRSHNPDVKGYIIEPASAPALAGGTVTNPGHHIQGGGYAMTNLPLLDGQHVAGYLAVTNAQAIEGARLLAREAGIFGGFSSGANLAGAAQLLRGDEAGKTIAFYICDSGLKYMSTDLYGGPTNGESWTE